MLVVKMMESK